MPFLMLCLGMKPLNTDVLYNSSLMIALSADPLLVWNYGTMGVIAAVACVAFWFSVRDLDTQEDELNSLPEGQVGKAQE